MGYQDEMKFNSKPSTIMHIDLNSCFATIEQQANPHLRGKPIAVAAYNTPHGCIVAPSVEAKKLGIGVGIRVKDGKLICPNLVVLTPDPAKYRNVHIALRKIISSYTEDYFPKSIDEFFLNMEGYPAYSLGMKNVAKKIKKSIKVQIGEAITVSVGIGPNRFLAKVAAGLRKPDGLDEINIRNYEEIYSNLDLTDLFGIKTKNAARLNSVGVYTVLDFYNAPLVGLRSAFQSVNAYYWYLRLRGWEIDDVEFGRRSYGNSYALPKPFKTPAELSPILMKLVEKMGARLRKAGYKARGVHLAIVYKDGGFWHKGITFDKTFFDSRDIYKEAFKIMQHSPYLKPVAQLAVSTFSLIKSDSSQLDLLEDVEKKESLTRAVDEVNQRWGNFVITPAKMVKTESYVPDRIAFGGVKELEEFVNRS